MNFSEISPPTRPTATLSPGTCRADAVGASLTGFTVTEKWEVSGVVLKSVTKAIIEVVPYQSCFGVTFNALL